jgi:hypothetical protein
MALAVGSGPVAGYGRFAPAVGYGAVVIHQGKKIMKRSLLLAAVLAFGLAACEKPARPPPPPPPVTTPTPPPPPPPPAAEAPKADAGAPAGAPAGDMAKDEMKKDDMKKDEMKK